MSIMKPQLGLALMAALLIACLTLTYLSFSDKGDFFIGFFTAATGGSINQWSEALFGVKLFTRKEKNPLLDPPKGSERT